METCLNVNILDVIRLKRDRGYISTVNKECFVISCRIKGESVFRFGTEEFTAAVGDLLYIPSDATYKQQTCGEEVIFIHLDIPHSSRKQMQLVRSDDPEKICKAFCEMESIWAQKDKNYAYRCTARLYDLMAETGIALPEPPHTQSALEPALTYMNNCFAMPDFSIKAACEKCSISRVHFNRLFQKEIKTTPVEYVNRLRIKTAKFLLKSGNYTNDEIAVLCGFHDIKYFYVVFKGITGMTPKAYKCIK